MSSDEERPSKRAPRHKTIQVDDAELQAYLEGLETNDGASVEPAGGVDDLGEPALPPPLPPNRGRGHPLVLGGVVVVVCAALGLGVGWALGLLSPSGPEPEVGAPTAPTRAPIALDEVEVSLEE